MYPKYRQAIDEARQFRNSAAVMIYEDEQRRYIPHITRSYLFPAAFNYSCALEILIKALLLIEGNFKKGHNLEELFNHLKDDTKAHIKSLTLLKTIQFKTFEYMLKEHSKIYYEWRYFFEGKKFTGNHLDFAFLMHFFNSIDQAIYDIYGNKFK